MSKLLKENVPHLMRVERTKLVEILEHLFHNTWDRTQFRKMFNFDIDFQTGEHSIDSAQLRTCLEYMKTHLVSPSAHESFVANLCNQHPNKASQIMQTLKLRVHQSRFAEQKLVALFQYCSFMDLVADFLLRDVFGPKTIKDKFDNIKSFLYRDVAYFLGNSVKQNTDPKFLCAIIQYILSFVQRTLPKCADYFKSCFNFIVSTLVGLIVRITNSESNGDGVEPAMNCLTYLVVDLREHFVEEITLLDTFPANDVFEKLHKLHKRIKYGNNSFRLTEELDCFLQVDTRSTDGLAALREQVFY